MFHFRVNLILLVFLLGGSLSSSGQPTNYIEKYKDIAVREMHRSGIPASITLAQGILESSWGNGALALKANNHFGIKCKSYWRGHTFYIEDDDYKNGKLVKSCFRAYDNAEDSYLDHTDFLTSSERYKPLFLLDHTDYKNWAFGLKKCGYATDKKYAYKLIGLIEKYRLDHLDIINEESVIVVNMPISRPPLETKKQDFLLGDISLKDDLEIPEPFVLPNDYKRGAGLSIVNQQKGREVIDKSATILWNPESKL